MSDFDWGSRKLATARLLWAAARPAPDVAEVTAALAAGPDLDIAVTLALGHRIGPLLWRAACLAGAEQSLGPTAGLLRAEVELRRAQALLLHPVAVRLAVEPLTGVGLEPLVFKGPALADRYPAPGLRPMDDIDLLLPLEHHGTALGALAAAGWVEVSDRLGDEHYDTYLVHERLPGLPLELHWDVASWRDRAAHLRGTALWAQRRPARFFGVDAFSLAPEVELVALAAHAGKPYHHFSRLIWSVDLAVVVERAGGALDWDEVEAAAHRAQCATVLAVGLHHARRLGAEIPERLLGLPRRGARRTLLDQVIAEEWPVALPDEQTAHQLRYAPWDSPTAQVALFLGDATRFGLRRAPRTAATDAVRGARQWWRLRRTAPTGERRPSL